MPLPAVHRTPSYSDAMNEFTMEYTQKTKDKNKHTWWQLRQQRRVNTLLAPPSPVSSKPRPASAATRPLAQQPSLRALVRPPTDALANNAALPRLQ